jgi:hypothetical protein
MKLFALGNKAFKQRMMMRVADLALRRTRLCNDLKYWSQ